MTSEKIYISGVAVKAGISRNKRKYLAKELEKFAPTLMGRPILLDHESRSLNTIGKVTETSYDENTTEVKYRGWIKGKDIVERIKDGRINTVSIGAIAGRVVKEKKDDDFVVPLDLEALELSTTPTPGNKGTSISTENAEYTEKQLTEMISSYEQENILNNNRKEDNKMENQNNIDENMKAEMAKMKEQLDAANAATEAANAAKAEVEEARRQDAIAKYKSICDAKKADAKDLSNASMEMVTFAIETVDGLPDPVEDEKEDDKKPADNKKEAEVQSQDKKPEDNKADETFADYVLENVTGGSSFYKTY